MEQQTQGLNGQIMSDEQIVTNFTQESIQQHSIDVRLMQVERLLGTGLVPVEGKTILATRVVVEPYNWDGNKRWDLSPGMYAITFAEGCKIPANRVMFIVQRSSLLRNGGIIRSSIFDAGYSCDNIGTMMILNHPISIELGARVASCYVHECVPVKNLYDGQWQGEKNLKS